MNELLCLLVPDCQEIEVAFFFFLWTMAEYNSICTIHLCIQLLGVVLHAAIFIQPDLINNKYYTSSNPYYLALMLMYQDKF
jgi:hypothetical protein